LLARAMRRWRSGRLGMVRLTYPDRTIRVGRGLTVLEASLRNAIPHAHVCGGRGRCSTCRIRVIGDLDELPEASAAELAVLDRIAAGPGVRLACQLRPDRDIAFVPLLPSHVSVSDLRRGGNRLGFGKERYLVMMFVDLRGSSRLAETRLPYDTVFIVNQFLNAVSRAIVAAGGQPNSVLGDGLLALFGLEVSPTVACRQAVAACARIGANVTALNLAMTDGLGEPLRFGIGVHCGMTIAGDIGFDSHAQFTVIGDAVNIAARLEGLTRTFGCEVLMSEAVYVEAGFGPDDLPAHEVEARGREALVKVRSVATAKDLELPEAAIA
jgi:adenylate cyclase